MLKGVWVEDSGRHALEKLHVAEEMLHGGAVHAKLKGVEWAEWFL